MNVDTLVIARAYVSKQGASRSEFLKPLLALAPTALTPVAWREELDGVVGRLIGDGTLDDRHRLVEPDRLARLIGEHSVKSWRQLADKVLPALALGVAPDDRKAHERLAGRDAWTAAIAARVLGLWEAGPPPSLPVVCDAFAWRSLGLPGKPKRCPPEIRAHFVQQRLGSDIASPASQIYLLAAQAVGVVRSDLKALLPGLIRMWLRGDGQLSGRADAARSRAATRPIIKPRVEVANGHVDPASVAEVRPSVDFAEVPASTAFPRALSVDLAEVPPSGDFAAEVRDVARAAREGVFGERRVFISSVWDQLRHQPRWSSLGLDDFKLRLLRAHRAGELQLARADLATALDPDLVATSETRTDGASFHFIVREAS